MASAKAPCRRGSTAATAASGSWPCAELVGDEMGDDLAVGLALEAAALGLHLLAQRLEILDDAVVDDGDAVDDVRMGVADRRRAVRRPAGVGDADLAGQRLRGERAGEIVELALGAAALEPAVDDRAEAAPNHSRDIRAAGARP